MYLIARGLPGLAMLLAVTIYTRLLAPASYGQYILVVAAVFFANAILFEWLRLGVLRFLPAYQQRQETFLSTVLASYLAIVAVTAFGGVIALLVIANPVTRILVAAGLLLSWLQGAFDLSLEMARIRLSPFRYGSLSLTRAIIALSVGTFLTFLGLGAMGPLLGLIIGLSAALAWAFSRDRMGLHYRNIDTSILRELLAYGLPLTATFALAFVISSSDRFLIGWFLGTAAAGQYAAGYDLAQKLLITLMTIINLAAYPLIVKAMEEGREGAAQDQLRTTLIATVAVSFPVALSLALLSPNVATLLLGHAFQRDATVLMPWIALGALLQGLKVYYADFGFQLGRHTLGQLWVVMVAATLNIALNLAWIPRFGILGSAYASVAAYLVALLMSWYLGQRILRLPLPFLDLGKVVLATMIVGVALLPVMQKRGVSNLMIQLVIAAAAYFSALLLFNPAGLRSRLSQSLLRRSTT